MRSERGGRRIGLAGEASQAGERRRPERTLRKTAAVEYPAERRGQPGRGCGIGPPRRALVDREGEQPLAVVRLARADDDVQVQLAATVHVASPNLAARMVEGRREPALLRPAETLARVAHRRPIAPLAIELANRGPRFRIVGDRRERQAAVAGHREPGGQQVLPGIAIGETPADQPEREMPFFRGEHRPEAGIGVGEHDLRLEPAGRQSPRRQQGRLPFTIRPDQPFVLGAQAAEIGGAAYHQRRLPGGRPRGERFRGEPRRRVQPARARPRIGHGGRRAGGKVRRPARQLRREDPARRAQTGARRIAFARHFDRQPLRQGKRRRIREKG